MMKSLRAELFQLLIRQIECNQVESFRQQGNVSSKTPFCPFFPFFAQV
jgi:hypothetical protein